ncbi:MAG: hypothetical protein DMG51_04035 [Acidobacteria bacterium]|nr:MAG: hypothetical protein DMG51_04035 [Acidobacteriota bacterium]
MPSPQKQKKIARAVPGVSLFHDTADEEMCTARGFPTGVRKWDEPSRKRAIGTLKAKGQHG